MNDFYWWRLSYRDSSEWEYLDCNSMKINKQQYGDGITFMSCCLGAGQCFICTLNVDTSRTLLQLPPNAVQ